MKQIKKKLPLRVYLSGAFLIFSAVLLIFMWIFQTVLLDPFYKMVKTSQVERCANSVVNHIESDDLLSMLKDIEEKNTMNVSVYETTNGAFNPIYTPDKFLNFSSMISMSTIYDYYQQAVDNNGKAMIKSDNSNGVLPYDMMFGFDMSLERPRMEMLACATIVEENDSEYFVVVESEITPVTSTVETLKIQLLIITAIIIIISIFIAVITARYIAKPIQDTNKKAKQLANQNYDLTFTGGVYKELWELTDTLTYTAHELQKVDSLRKELIANVSHDLRTPLTMITGYSEVMRDLPNENTPENAQIIIDEANRLSELVNDLLDISKLESGAIAMQNCVFNLTDCIKAIFTRYTKLVKQNGYRIVFEHNDDVYIFADPLRISQVMYNLLNNAINYCGEDKTVVVRQSVRDGYVCIEVIDHGNGIEESQLEYIWDRYYKIDKEHKQAVIGTGLGLSIVKNILLLYNARFGVNTKLGFGSDFWWMLPVVENDASTNNIIDNE